MKKLEKITTQTGSEKTLQIFEKIKATYGMVPNLYAVAANSENALESYLAFSDAQQNSSLSKEEREVVYLAASETNGCHYCTSAHSMKAEMLGFQEEEILEIREGSHPDPKIDALIKITNEIVNNAGNAESEIVSEFYNAGYDSRALIDIIALITEVTFTNYLGRLAHPCVDFPQAPVLSNKVII